MGVGQWHMAFNLFNTLKITLISITLFTTFLFSLLLLPRRPSPNYPSEPHLIPRRTLLLPAPAAPKCSLSNLTATDGLLNYSSLHPCVFRGRAFISVPFLTLALLLQFYVLVKTAQDRFSVVVTRLSARMKLSPSMGAVTLLALGNGAPDVFASVAAVRGGQPRTGFGAILSAGTFVSAFVVGFVTIYAAPFAVDPAPFVRDVLFYLTAALFLFYVYLSAEIYLWQAMGFVGFYIFFVGVVFWMDLGYAGGERNKRSGDGGVELLGSVDKCETGGLDCADGGLREKLEAKGRPGFGFWDIIGKVSKTWQIPVSTLLKLTIPETSPAEWSRFYQSANIALCPLAFLYSCRSFMPLDYPISFLLPTTHLPLWSVVFFGSCSLAGLHYALERAPPKTEWAPTLVAAFAMSVFWISMAAGELLDCLAALGELVGLPPALLGLTVLAWGNSVGDLVADVAVARAGQPAMAMAGCFACPMFNMLFGLGTGLVMQTAEVFPGPYGLRFHTSIVVAFVFLVVSLMGSLLVVIWNRFRVPRFWGFCLVGLYVVFMAVSLVIAGFSL